MKLMKMILAIIFLGGLAINASGRDTLMFRNVTHRITAEVRPVHNMATHGFYRGYNDFDTPIPAATSVHLRYGFSLNPESSLGRLYPTTYQGIGLAVHSFFNHNITGTPVILYMFQGSSIADLGKNITLDCEWGLGASYGWKVNEVVSSRWNIFINVGLPLTWHISPEWEISFGPEYTHFSNGDTSFPNGGANTVGCRLGVTGKINSNKREKALGHLMIKGDEDLQQQKFAERISYDLTVYGAWRADRKLDGYKLTIINKPFFTGGINFNPLYRFNRYFSAGPAADLMIDMSAGEAFGLAVRGEVTMPFFSINLGAGYTVLSNSNELRGFYSTYNLKASLSEKFYLNIGYRLSSVLFSHSLMFGFGVRF